MSPLASFRRNKSTRYITTLSGTVHGDRNCVGVSRLYLKTVSSLPPIRLSSRHNILYGHYADRSSPHAASFRSLHLPRVHAQGLLDGLESQGRIRAGGHQRAAYLYNITTQLYNTLQAAIDIGQQDLSSSTLTIHFSSLDNPTSFNTTPKPATCDNSHHCPHSTSFAHPVEHAAAVTSLSHRQHGHRQHQ